MKGPNKKERERRRPTAVQIGERKTTNRLGELVHQKFYRLSKKMQPYSIDRELLHGTASKYRRGFKYICVSAACVLGKPETYIFGCYGKRRNLDMGELPGSTKGWVDHAQLLQELGYKVLP